MQVARARTHLRTALEFGTGVKTEIGNKLSEFWTGVETLVEHETSEFEGNPSL